MSGPQDVGIRNSARSGPSSRYASSSGSPTDEVDDDHIATSHPVRDTYRFLLPITLTVCE